MNDRPWFTAVTYNVLAQAYVFSERYPNCVPEALAAEPRRARVVSRLLALDADLLCLQEVEPELFASAQLALGDGFASALASKVGKPDGCAVFARRSVFAWRGDEVVRYQSQRGEHRPLALVAHLEFDGAPLSVANTHLTFQPESTPGHVGLAQMGELLARRAAQPDATWLLAGDLNAISTSAVVQAALAAGLEESCRAQRPWDTTNIHGRCRKIDYLLSTAGHLRPAPLALPPLDRATPMPSLREPSDHLPLAVRFRRE